MKPDDSKDKDGIVGSSDISEKDDTASEPADPPREVGGRGGLDPTRYGDWEKAGRCIDF
jgi:hypothetical protein